MSDVERRPHSGRCAFLPFIGEWNNELAANGRRQMPHRKMNGRARRHTSGENQVTIRGRCYATIAAKITQLINEIEFSGRGRSAFNLRDQEAGILEPVGPRPYEMKST